MGAPSDSGVDGIDSLLGFVCHIWGDINQGMEEARKDQEGDNGRGPGRAGKENGSPGPVEGYGCANRGLLGDAVATPRPDAPTSNHLRALQFETGSLPQPALPPPSPTSQQEQQPLDV